MSFAKTHPVLTGIFGLTALAALALGYLIYSQLETFAELQTSYQGAVRELQQLESRKPYPSPENLKAAEEKAASFKTAINEFAADLRKRSRPAAPISPQDFQNKLKAMVSDIERKASAEGVILPKGFYLGFEQYETTLPSLQESPQLSRDLDAIAWVVNRLVELRIKELVSVSREPQPPAQPAATPPPKRGPPQQKQDAKAEESQPLIETTTVNIAFISDEPRFRQAFNSLLSVEPFYLIRSLAIENSSPQGPPRAGSETGTAQPTVPSAPDENAIKMVVGRELVKVAMRIEILNFNIPEVK